MKQLVKYLLASVSVIISFETSALESVSEDLLRSVSGQEGVKAELNYKATLGRFYLETNGNSLNLNNVSIDTDGSSNDSTLDRPIKMDVDIVNNGFISGLGIKITEVNDIDVSIGSITVASGPVSANDPSYGGFSLTNINDGGGQSDISVFSKGASGAEGLRINLKLANTMSLNWAYTDNGPNASATNDDFSLSSKLILSNVTAENNIDVVQGVDDSTSAVGGLRLNIVSLSGDVALNTIQAGDVSVLKGSMGRIQVNNFQLSPKSYLTVQGI